MATFTWIGNQGTGGDPNDFTAAANWSPVGPPGPDDTFLIPSGSSGSPVTVDLTGGSLTGNIMGVGGPFDTLNFTSDTLDSINSAIGAGAVINITDSQVITSAFTLENAVTLNLVGSTATSFGFDLNHSGSQNRQIVQLGSTALINASGTINSNAAIFAQTPGGTMDIIVGQDGAHAGLLLSQGPIVDRGEILGIFGDSNTSTRFANNGFMLVDGASAGAEILLTASLSTSAGATEILGSAHGAVFETDTNMSGGQAIVFGDGTGILKIDATSTLANFSGVSVLSDFTSRILGFQAGDTVDLTGIAAIGLSWSYGNSTTFGTNALTIVQNGNTIGALRFNGDWVGGTGSIGGANATNFVFASDGNGGTQITLQSQNAISGGTTVAVTPTLANFIGAAGGATIDWGTGANWSGGSGAGGLPGQFQLTQLVATDAEVLAYQASTQTNYVLTVSSAETAGSLVVADPFVTLDISAPLTLSSAPGQTSGGGVSATEGTMTIAAGGVLTAVSFYQSSSDSGLTVASGGSLHTAGSVPFVPDYGLSGVEIEGDGLISGGTVTSGGNFVIGSQNAASLEVTTDPGSSAPSDVTATYTSIGGYFYPSPDGSVASLDLSGAGTVWQDVGGDSGDTPYSGAMLVGGGLPNDSAISNNTTATVGTSGAGLLTIENGASLIDSSFAALGLRPSSFGEATVQNNAVWSINPSGGTPPTALVLGSTTVQTGSLPWLTVGLTGTGELNIRSGGTVELGTGEENSIFKMTIGEGGTSNASAVGMVTVDHGLLSTGGGPLDIGSRGHGTMAVTDGGTVEVAADFAATAINYGVVLGRNQDTINDVLQLGAGVLTVGGGTGTSLFLDTGDFDDGRDGSGSVTVESGGSMHATGRLYIGGNISSGTPVQSLGSGLFSVTGGGIATVANVQMWQGNTLSLSGQSEMVIGNLGGTPGQGELSIASNGTLAGAGLVTVSSNISEILNNGLIFANLPGQTLELNAAVTGSGTYEIGLTGQDVGDVMRLDQSVASGTQFKLGINGVNTLELASPVNFHGTISGFYGTVGADTVDLVTLPFSSAHPSVSYTANADPTTGGTIDITSTSGDFSLAVTGFHPGGFQVHGDGAAGGTAIVANDAAPCFVAGTHILTASGERPVEGLRMGDLLPTLQGGTLRRIVWIGRTSIDLDRHPDPARSAPIRVCADAFGPGAPHRDLLLSPDHALWVEDALIPAHLLVNGATILREPAAGVVRYFHVELDRHDLLLAEGLPAESYLDTGNRFQFAGADIARTLYPDLCADLSARAWDARACVELLLGGPRVRAAHARLAARAEALGHQLTEDPALRIEADGMILTAETTRTGIRVKLPAGTGTLRLLSRSVVPLELDHSTDDPRRLGVAVTSLRRDGGTLALHGSCLADGFHPIERDEDTAWRWTDGAATLRLRNLPRASVLEIDIIPGWRRYCESAAPPAAIVSAATVNIALT